jgi:hypothetical protein
MAINIKKSFIVLLSVGLHHENLIYESGDFSPFFSLLATENLQNHFFSNFLFFISLFANFASIKNAQRQHVVPVASVAKGRCFWDWGWQCIGFSPWAAGQAAE